LTRFLLFALALLLILIALFNLGLEVVGLQPDLGPLVGWHGGDRGLPGVAVLATWALEALALAALFLLVDGRGGSRLLNGLLSGWIAWVFRGPLLVMTAVGYGGQPRAPWWGLTRRWFVLYTLAGALLALVAALVRLPRGGDEAVPGTAAPPAPHRERTPVPEPTPSHEPAATAEPTANPETIPHDTAPAVAEPPPGAEDALAGDQKTP